MARTKKADQLVDVSRAAELLGASYNGVRNAIDSGFLKASTTFEKKSGRVASLIRRGDLDDYRKMLIAYHKGNPAKTERVAALRKIRVK